MIKLIYFIFPFLKNKKIARIVIIILIVAGIFAIVSGLVHIFTPLELITNNVTGEPADINETAQFVMWFVFLTTMWIIVYYIHRKNAKRNR